MVSEAVAQSVQQWPIDNLIFYARNPRKNDSAVDRMCGSIREFGFKIPVLARSNGEVVDGHLRLKAARKLGISDIPVILCDDGVGAGCVVGQAQTVHGIDLQRGVADHR